MSYHLTRVRMGIIRKSTNNKCWRWCGEKGTILHCWWECKLLQPLWRTVRRFLKKLKIKLPYDPVIPLLGIYPEKTKNLQPRLLYPARISFRFNREIKIFTDKQKLREFSTIKPALQQMLKELL